MRLVLQYASIETFQSELFPGVSYVLKKRSAARRAQFNLSIAGLSARIREFQQQGELAESQFCDGCNHKVSEHNIWPGKCEHAECDCQEGSGSGFTDRARYLTEINQLDSDEIQPKRLKTFVKEITGLEIDGAPATLETALADGPDELLDEIDQHIKKLITLSEAERKNSESLSTSGAVAE